MEKIIQRAKLLRLRGSGVVPKTARARLGDKGIEMAIAAQIVFPDMAAPPVFSLHYFRQEHQSVQRLDHARFDERFESAAAADEDVEIFYAGAVFGGDPAGVLRTARGHQLHVDAELRLEDGFELLA